MLETRNINGKACPFFSCDYCGQPIKTADMASAEWYEPGEERQRLYVLHKGGCNRAFEERYCAEHPGASYSGQDLDTEMVYLLANLKVNMKRARENARIMECL